MLSFLNIFYRESNSVMHVFKNTYIILIPLKAKRICVPNVQKPQNQDFVQVRYFSREFIFLPKTIQHRCNYIAIRLPMPRQFLFCVLSV